ncbi:hypothetical protein Tsubulata_048942 [Turnera subulata]|uniref:Uncharacterized protein n=1 Tax=Turnera subulata TaxID=218843 RepID=A0A9Q0FDU4_9ROSI|nr:hypothetical protein Tsubulata_048942 [Turnera subulata]
MFGTTSPDLEIPQKSLQIRQDDKFFSRLLSKETSMANPSFRVYYGGVSVAVPFVWESQPGTPKHPLSESTLPPLTPPPSYYTNSNKKPTKKHSRSNLLHLLFPRISLKRTNDTTFPPSPSSTFSHSPSSASSWSSSSLNNSSSSLSSLTTPKKSHARSRFSSRGSSFDSRVWQLDEEAAGGGSPTSTLCFGVSGRTWWS